MPIESIKNISIIIPVYQAKDTLRRCVLSCINQKDIDPKEIEVILVDDGSTDGSASLADELAKEDSMSRIIVKHTTNHGVSHARNVGMECASGRFVAFVDADDYVEEDFLSGMFKHADEGTIIVDENRNFSLAQKISGYNYIENSVLNANTHVWGKFFDREAMEEGQIRFKEGLTIGEDLLFLLDIALFIGKKRCIRCFEGDAYVYVENENSAMNRAFKESYLDQLECWRQAEEMLLEVQEFLSPYALVSVGVSQILTALLVAGKVAVQGADRDEKLDKLAITKVKEQINHALKRRGVFAGLSLGHKIKILVFRANPDLYVRLYAKHKTQ